MAGHSKWANIKHRKGAQDARRGRVFSKISKEITVAALSGTDPAMNAALRLAIAKAKAHSMPKKTIANAVAKATSNASGINFKELTYGANVGGVSFLITCLTDNVKRTQADVQHLINRFNGTISSASAVAYVFERLGILALKASEHDEETLFTKAINLGASDFERSDDTFFIYTNPATWSDLKMGLEADAITNFTTAEVAYVARQEVMLAQAKANRILELIELLDNNDDVQNVYHNLDANALL